MFAKLRSGRYILTLMTGFTFVYATIKGILPPEAVAAIISLVFVSYFNRKKENEPNG